jgi:hypothetical protein
VPVKPEMTFPAGAVAVAATDPVAVAAVRLTAFGINTRLCRDLTWMNWISTPSISVVNSGSALSLASAFYVMVAAVMAFGRPPQSAPPSHPNLLSRRPPIAG